MQLTCSVTRMTSVKMLQVLVLAMTYAIGVESSWEEWWTYDGISGSISLETSEFHLQGPDYWGLLNPEWKLCNRGRRQSPIDIQPSLLLYDPGMGKLKLDSHKVNGTLKNTGHSVRLRLDLVNSPLVHLEGGPLSYKYRIHEVLLHYGWTDDKGSEHTISGHAFPVELQVVGYNFQLYENMTEALTKTQGIVAVSVMMQISNISSPNLRLLTSQLDKIIHKGQTVNINHISVEGILPDTSQFMTYEGSATMPGCQETVTWIVLNKPIYITKAEMFQLRRLMQGDVEHPKTILANNYRPPQPLYNRSVRTNVFNHDIGATLEEYTGLNEKQCDNSVKESRNTKIDKMTS